MKEKTVTAIALAVLALAVTGAALLSPSGKPQKRETEAAAVWYNEPVHKVYDSNGTELIVDNISYESYDYNDKPPVREGLGQLTDMINDYISKRGGDWGVYIKNMKTREYLSINEKEYSAASLIKLYTAAAVYNELAAGTLKAAYDIYETGADKAYDDISYNLRIMLCESDNHACNYLTERLGGGSAARGFEIENKNTAALGCRNTSHNSEIVDGGSITVLGRNYTSPMDCGILLEHLYYGTLVSNEASAKMLSLLQNQQRTWKIPAGVPEGTKTANKTGETDTTEGDAAIVYSPNCNYIICAIGNGNVGGGVETIRHISEMTYDYFNPKENGIQ